MLLGPKRNMKESVEIVVNIDTYQLNVLIKIKIKSGAKPTFPATPRTNLAPLDFSTTTTGPTTTTKITDLN